MQPLKPTECRRCGAKLSGSDPEPLRHQVWELPEIKPQRDRVPTASAGVSLLRRDDMRGTARRRAARAVGTAVDGIHRAADGLLSSEQAADGRVPRHAVGPALLPGLTVKIQNQVTDALRPAYEALAAQLPTQEQLNIDETATKEENGKAWLWTFVARMFTVFAVRPRARPRRSSVFLGEKFRGVVTCDRAKMYWQLGDCSGAGRI